MASRPSQHKRQHTPSIPAHLQQLVSMKDMSPKRPKLTTLTPSPTQYPTAEELHLAHSILGRMQAHHGFANHQVPSQELDYLKMSNRPITMNAPMAFDPEQNTAMIDREEPYGEELDADTLIEHARQPAVTQSSLDSTIDSVVTKNAERHLAPVPSTLSLDASISDSMDFIADNPELFPDSQSIETFFRSRKNMSWIKKPVDLRLLATLREQAPTQFDRTLVEKTFSTEVARAIADRDAEAASMMRTSTDLVAAITAGMPSNLLFGENEVLEEWKGVICKSNSPHYTDVNYSEDYVSFGNSTDACVGATQAERVSNWITFFIKKHKTKFADVPLATLRLFSQLRECANDNWLHPLPMEMAQSLRDFTAAHVFGKDASREDKMLSYHWMKSSLDSRGRLATVVYNGKKTKVRKVAQLKWEEEEAVKKAQDAEKVAKKATEAAS